MHHRISSMNRCECDRASAETIGEKYRWTTMALQNVCLLSFSFLYGHQKNKWCVSYQKQCWLGVGRGELEKDTPGSTIGLFQLLCGDGYILPIKISKYATLVYEIDKFWCAIRLILIHSLFSKLKLIDHLLDLQWQIFIVSELLILFPYLTRSILGIEQSKNL